MVAVVVFRCLLIAVAGELDAPIDTRKHVGFLKNRSKVQLQILYFEEGISPVDDGNHCARLCVLLKSPCWI